MPGDDENNKGYGVFVSTREIYDKLLSVEHKMITREEFEDFDKRLRSVEVAVKAIPPALILVLITIILAFVQMSTR